jgi:histidinol-phosphate/aromatic aminotransferase/cobyric acid decarboxylase-like protein
MLVPLQPDGANSAEAMVEAITNSTTAVFASSPNNPTVSVLLMALSEFMV